MSKYFNTNGDNRMNPPPPPTPTNKDSFSDWLQDELVDFGLSQGTGNGSLYGYVLSQSFIGQISINTTNNSYTYVNGEILQFYTEWIGLESVAPAGGLNVQGVIEDLTGEIIGQLSTQNAINYNPAATVTDYSSVMPQCTDQAAAVLYQNVINYPEIESQLDNDQLNCLNSITSIPDYSDDDLGTPPAIGCTDPLAYNYDPSATVDGGGCYYPITDDGEPFVPDTSIITTLGITNDQYTSLIDDTIALVQELQTELEACDEGTIEALGLEGDLEAAQQQVTDLLSTEGILNAVENTISQISSEGGCDATSQAVIDSFTALNAQAADSTTVQALQTLCAANDNITQADLNVLIADLDYVYGEVGALYEAAGLDLLGMVDYSVGNYDGSLTLTNILGNEVPTGTNQNNINILLTSLNTAIVNLQNSSVADSAALTQALTSLNDIQAQLSLGINYTSESVGTLGTTQITQAIQNLQASEAYLEILGDDNAALSGELADVLANIISALQAGGVATPINATYPNIFTGEMVDSGIELDTLGYSQEVLSLVQTLANVTPQNPDLQYTYGQLEDAYYDGYADGEASVDITSDNADVAAAAYADGVASVVAEDGIGQGDVDAAYASGLTDGANSVDITSDNQAVEDEAYASGYDDGVASVVPEDGISQEDVDAAYADGVNSVTPEDGITQADVDAAFAEGQVDGAASVTPEDGISQADVDEAYADGVASVDQILTQADVDAAYADGAASVTPEDGISQEDVDAAYAEGVASVTPEDGITQADVDAAYAEGAASVTPEDGIGQSDVDSAYDDGVASVNITSDNTQAIEDAIAEGTELYNEIFNAGAASVDITTDNQDVADSAYADGVDSLATTIESLESQIESLLDASGADTEAAYLVLEEQLANTENQLQQASANNAAWEDFLSDLDVGMSRLEKFLTDSYGYDVNAEVPRATLTIPTNMSDVNPNFLNEPLSDTSIYVGDGTTGSSTAYDAYLEEFGGFAGKSDEKKRLSGFLNMMGRAKKVKQGFMNFAGQEPFSRVEGNGEEEESTFELTKGAKTGLYLFGGALAAFGIFKLVNKK